MAKKSPEQKALERIQRAARKGSTKLDLSRRGLKSIPSALWRLTHLTDLRLNKNQLANLPDALRNLANLQVLNPTGNPLPDALMAAYECDIAELLAYLRGDVFFL